MLSITLNLKVTRTQLDNNIVPVIEDLTNGVYGLKFGTALPGGFISCFFSLLLPKWKAYEWYERLLLYGITIWEADSPIWEGRIASISLAEHGLNIECEGYWASMADQTIWSWFADNDMGK